MKIERIKIEDFDSIDTYLDALIFEARKRHSENKTDK